MYGLEGKNFEFLRGQELHQICFGVNDLILNLDGGNTSILVTSYIATRDDNNDLNRHNKFTDSSTFLLSLLNRKIINVYAVDPKTLCISFSDRKDIYLYDDSNDYESIVIKSENLGKEIII